MDMKWVYIAFTIFLIIGIYPAWRYWLKNSPKAEKGDWLAFLFPISMVIAFVAVLMLIVAR